MPAQLKPVSISDSAAGSGSEQCLVRHLDLFSGIGGFALAAKMASGIETVGFCEIDPWARRVLNKNFPNVPIHEDVKTLNPKNYGRIDLITGGYPCQPFSHAGKRRGTEDARHLWPEVRRIIATARPRWVLCENVDGHITMGLDEVLADLDSIGYTGRATVIPACAVNALHRRSRVWILAHPNGSRFQQSDEAVAGRSPEQSHGLCVQPGQVPSDPSRRELEIRPEKPIPGIAHLQGELRRSGETVCISTHPHEPGVLRATDGIPNRVDRIKGLGNAIVPQVAAEILRCMMHVDSLLPNAGAHTPTP